MNKDEKNSFVFMFSIVIIFFCLAVVYFCGEEFVKSIPCWLCSVILFTAMFCFASRVISCCLIKKSINTLNGFDKKKVVYLKEESGKKIFSQSDFKNYKNLQRIDFINDVDFLESDVFQNCLELKEINFYGTLKYYLPETFSTCKKLERVSFSNLKVLYAKTFYGSPVKYVSISGGLESIEEEAFGNCVNLQEIFIDSKILQLPDSFAFWTKNAYIFKIPNTVIKIGKFSFCGSENLKYIRFDGSIDAFKQIYKENYWKTLVSEDCEIICNDKTVNLVEINN